jgi:hypothetical protein
MTDQLHILGSAEAEALKGGGIMCIDCNDLDIKRSNF